MTELPKEWHELAQRESVILNPSNSNNQEIYRLAHNDGATAYRQAVEAKAKEYIDFYVRMADNDAVSILNAFLTELQTLKPTSND
jgi:hypothetical protein